MRWPIFLSAIIAALVTAGPKASIEPTADTATRAPAVKALPATDVGWTIATLRGQVDSNDSGTCEYRFRYTRTQASYPYTYTAWAGSVVTGQTFSEQIGDLSPGLAYEFSVQSRNSAGEGPWSGGQPFSTQTVVPGQFQSVEGFAAIAHSPNQGNYGTYRGQQTQSYWEYAAEADSYIEWQTAAVPASYSKGRVTFVWSGANGTRQGWHDLYLDGMRILRFHSGQATDRAWKNGNYELFFDFKNHNADNAGVYYFTVPATRLTGNRQATIRVQAAVSGGGLDWIMVHDFTDTLAFETSSGRLNYDHLGRADQAVAGNCSNGIQDGDETGVDCGGSCETRDPEICNGIDDNKNCFSDEGLPSCTSKFRYGHYYVIAQSVYCDNAKAYVRDVNDLGYSVLVDVLGFAPEIDTYIVDFTLKNFAGGFYTGLKTIDGITGGKIDLWDTPIKTPAVPPRDLCYDLLYETIHGLTEPLKHDIHTRQPRHKVMERGEDFDIIFEVEVLDRLAATDCVNALYAAFYRNSLFPHFPVYYDIRQQYGWGPIRMFLGILDGIKNETHVDTDDQECYYLSIAVGADVSAIYEAHNKPISQETKDKIQRDVVP